MRQQFCSAEMSPIPLQALTNSPGRIASSVSGSSTQDSTPCTPLPRWLPPNDHTNHGWRKFSEGACESAGHTVPAGWGDSPARATSCRKPPSPSPRRLNQSLESGWRIHANGTGHSKTTLESALLLVEQAVHGSPLAAPVDSVRAPSNESLASLLPSQLPSHTSLSLQQLESTTGSQNIIMRPSGGLSMEPAPTHDEMGWHEHRPDLQELLLQEQQRRAAAEGSSHHSMQELAESRKENAALQRACAYGKVDPCHQDFVCCSQGSVML